MNTLTKKLDAINRRIAERCAHRQEHTCPASDYIDDITAEASKPPPELQTRQSLFEMEQLGLFTSSPVVPNNEYPTLLTRLPIFPPILRSRQKKRLDQDNALVFKTPFGTGRRHGPPLTTEDEDTLIVLLTLRDRRITGRADRLPFPVPGVYSFKEDGCCCVHTVVCTASQILEMKGISNGGSARDWTLESIRRLAATTLEINVNKHERYFGKMTKGTTIKLLDVVWSIYETEGYLLMQFSPIVANWLEREYTYISWSVRKELTELGKSVHRFLSSQPKYYKGELATIAKVIGCDIPNRNLRPRFREVLDKLVTLDWLKQYKISGTGRNTPLTLETWR
jgi:hypothetical protein